jgi:hypothetical protein
MPWTKGTLTLDSIFTPNPNSTKTLNAMTQLESILPPTQVQLKAENLNAMTKKGLTLNFISIPNSNYTKPCTLNAIMTQVLDSILHPTQSELKP